MDWAAMVLEMYKRWAFRRGYDVELVEETAGELAGIRSGSIKVNGEYAYGWLRSEIGVHRLVRVSPFDANVCAVTSMES
jgi:peptide chain release factor 2